MCNNMQAYNVRTLLHTPPVSLRLILIELNWIVAVKLPIYHSVSVCICWISTLHKLFKLFTVLKVHCLPTSYFYNKYLHDWYIAQASLCFVLIVAFSVSMYQFLSFDLFILRIMCLVDILYKLVQVLLLLWNLSITNLCTFSVMIICFFGMLRKLV